MLLPLPCSEHSSDKDPQVRRSLFSGSFHVEGRGKDSEK